MANNGNFSRSSGDQSQYEEASLCAMSHRCETAQRPVVEEQHYEWPGHQHRFGQ